jgi:polysaccharide biosynthesis protein PelF
MIVPPRNPEALADACLALLKDATLRRKLGAAARMRALEYFTVDRAISAFDEIYTFVGAGLSLPTAEMDDESDDLMPASLAERDDETELLQALEAAG